MVFIWDKVIDFLLNLLNNAIANFIVMGIIAFIGFLLFKKRRKKLYEKKSLVIMNQTFEIRLRMYEKKKFNYDKLVKFLTKETGNNILFVPGTDRLQDNELVFNLKNIGEEIDHSIIWKLILKYQLIESKNVYYELHAVYQIA